MGEASRPIRYRFGDFTVSPARRLLLCSGAELPLIPRYFDLLVLLLERRHEAVTRRVILDRVWSDVVVTDGALTQAVRTLRRTLEGPRPGTAFIRTVSRHGYQFAFDPVVEEPDDGALPTSPPPAAAQASSEAGIADPLEAALERLLAGDAAGDGNGDPRREAAETLHALGTAEALRRLDRRRGHAQARALLRDARWDVPGAGPVPLLGQPGSLEAVLALIRLRLARALRVAEQRWASASAGGAAAGLAAGAAGGLVLLLAPGAHLPGTLPVVLGVVGATIGAVGAAGVGAGLAAAEMLFREMRSAALVLLGALGGGAVGAAAHLLARWTIAGLFGHDFSPVGGGLEGLAIGAGAGLGYALSTPRPAGGMAAPRGADRIRVAATTALTCALAGILLTRLGRPLGGVSLDTLARSFPGSQVGLAPLARLFGEADLGPLTRTVLSVWEGGVFGFGLALGLTRRPDQG